LCFGCELTGVPWRVSGSVVLVVCWLTCFVLFPPSIQDARTGTIRQDSVNINVGQGQAFREAPPRSPQFYEENSPPQTHNITTIHEGHAVVAPASARDKAMSPPRSASATTGSSTTPTSLGNASSSGGIEGAAKGPVPEFPKGFAPPSHQQQSHLQQPQMHQESAEAWQYGSFSAEAEASVRQGSGSVQDMDGGAALKMLVSNNVAGSIIGRGGQTISELQSESNTRIKLSQSGDYYPGTQDRVCLVQGEPSYVRQALQLLLERFYLLQEAQHRPAWQPQQEIPGVAHPSFDFVVRLLVPISCCGMIIGKAGSNIKCMEENTGVTSIRLSPKDDGGLASTMERVVTITGHALDCCLQCVYLVFDGMASHPDISRYANMTTSYANCMVPSTSVAPSYAGSPGNLPSRNIMTTPVSPTRQAPSEQHHFWEGAGVSPFHQGMHPSAGLTRRFVSTPDLPGTVISDMQSIRFGPDGHFHDRLVGYGVHSQPPYSPMQTTQLSVSTNSMQGPLYLMPRPNEAPLMDIGRVPSGNELLTLQHNRIQSSVSHSTSAPDLLAIQLEQSLHLSQPPQPPLHSSHHHMIQQHMHHHQAQQQVYSASGSSTLVPQTPTMIAPGCFNAQVLVPDTMIGSILGRGGRTLSELQMLSGTRIRISQRGEYMPGTRSRIVNIRGPTAQSVWQSQYIMSHRVMLPPTAAYSAPPARSLSSGSYQTQQEVTESSDQGSPP
jgi:KH domain